MSKFQDIFDAQKALFATGITRTYEWRVDQLGCIDVNPIDDRADSFLAAIRVRVRELTGTPVSAPAPARMATWRWHRQSA